MLQVRGIDSCLCMRGQKLAERNDQVSNKERLILANLWLAGSSACDIMIALSLTFLVRLSSMNIPQAGNEMLIVTLLPISLTLIAMARTTAVKTSGRCRESERRHFDTVDRHDGGNGRDDGYHPDGGPHSLLGLPCCELSRSDVRCLRLLLSFQTRLMLIKLIKLMGYSDLSSAYILSKVSSLFFFALLMQLY